MAAKATAAPAHWSADVYREPEARDIKTVCTIPDGGLIQLLNMVDADPGMRLVTLSTEEEGMGVVVGQWAGGVKAMIAMQSSGVGNCINALPSERLPGAVPDAGDDAWAVGRVQSRQLSMGQGRAAGAGSGRREVLPVDRPEEVGEVFGAAAADMASTAASRQPFS
ncbi:MAG: hypothetical protein R3D67_04355 [Hyphomicrobiaceae bacterium]